MPFAGQARGRSHSYGPQPGDTGGHDRRGPVDLVGGREPREAKPQAGAGLVVVDGGSTDGTSNWLETVAADGRTDDIRWISRPDSGIGEAWNRAVALADGDWVLFLGCDDQVGDPVDHGVSEIGIDR